MTRGRINHTLLGIPQSQKVQEPQDPSAFLPTPFFLPNLPGYRIYLPAGETREANTANEVNSGWIEILAYCFAGYMRAD